MFNAFSICYLFLGGAGAGALVLLGAMEIVNARRYVILLGGTERSTLPTATSLIPSETFFRCWPICTAVLATGIVCLILDAGRADRLLALFLSPTRSPLSIGAWALTVSLLCAVHFTGVNVFGIVRTRAIPTYAVAAAGIVAGLVTAVYTGVFLAGMPSVLAWQTPLIPAIFTVSALSCGAGIVLFGAAFVETRYGFMESLLATARLDSALIVVELLLLGGYAAWLALTPTVTASADALLTGALAPPFLGGVVVMGLVLPFALERALTYGSHHAQLLFIAGLVLFGGLMLRYCITGLAAYDVTQLPEVNFGLLL